MMLDLKHFIGGWCIGLMSVLGWGTMASNINYDSM